MTIGDDLRRFRASPEVPRLAVALFATAAVMLFAVASTNLPNTDNAAPQAHSQGQVSNPETLQDSRELVRPAAAAPLGCTKLHRGQWLRVEIQHKADRGLTKMKCFYGYGPQFEAL